MEFAFSFDNYFVALCFTFKSLGFKILELDQFLPEYLELNCDWLIITMPLPAFMLILFFLDGPRLMLYFPGNSSFSFLIACSRCVFSFLGWWSNTLSVECDGLRLCFLCFTVDGLSLLFD